MEIAVLAEAAVKLAIKKGCDAAEVFIKGARGVSVEAKGGEVEALKASRDFCIALKVIRKQRLGFSFTTNRDDIEKTIDEALQGADWTGTDMYVDIPDYMPPAEVSVLDEEIESVKEEDVIKDALFLEERALAFDRRIKKVRKAEVGIVVEDTAVFNSKGVNISYRSSYAFANVSTLAQDNGSDSQMGWDFAISRRKGEIDLGSVGRIAARRAVELLGSRKISAVRAPVILDSSVAAEFLEILSASLSAEAVQKKRSFLAGKVGKTIISPIVDIVDDGAMPWKIGTKPVDDEGVPVSSKTLISKGVLTGFIHNTYTAKKAGVISTGNAVRGSSKSLPGVGVTNFYIKPKKSQESVSLIKSVSKGLLILNAMGVHTADPVSGDFSVGISGRWIENGETVYPVKEAVISGNILDLFKKVEDIGGDLRFYGDIGSPGLLIGEMDISA